MLYVTLCRPKRGTDQERIARRLEWRIPAGMRLLGEYWLRSENPSVIAVAEAESVGPIVAALADWDDYFEMTVVPAITAEEGLELAGRGEPRLVAVLT